MRQGPPPEQERATWTLHNLAKALAERFEHIPTMSHEAVRRLFGGRDILYRQAKYWLTSPDPLYELHKRQRDRLLVMARTAPDGAAVWIDESWFVRWPYRFWAWTKHKELPRVALRWNEDVESTALFAALDDESQETFLRWAAGQLNSERMVPFLEALMAFTIRKTTQAMITKSTTVPRKTPSFTPGPTSMVFQSPPGISGLISGMVTSLTREPTMPSHC